jgi:hypothetical protein
MVKLFRDHYEHRDGKVIKHPAGSVVDLPPEVVAHINRGTLMVRERNRVIAAKRPGTPEYRR